jgi:hypothetical protein
MSDLDDRPLDRTDTPQRAPAASATRLNPVLIGGVVFAALLLGALARWWTMEKPAPSPEAATAPVAGTEVALPATQTLPPMAEMDPFLRVLLGTLSTRPELSKWLATDDLIHQLASIVDRLAAGASPARDLKVLIPVGDFAVSGRAGRRSIDPASYRRYDGLAATFAELDPAAVARVYRTIKPRLSEAYRSLGRSDADIDSVLRQAIEVIVSTPTVSDPVGLVEGKGATWAFADPSLEQLDPAQKHLLRMGPANATRVKEQLRRIRDTIGAAEPAGVPR